MVGRIEPFNLYIEIGRHWYSETCNHHITDEPQAMICIMEVFEQKKKKKDCQTS